MSPCVAKEPFHGVGTTIGRWSQKSREPLAPHTQFSHTHFATTTWPSHSTHSPHTILKLLNDKHTRPILCSHLRLRYRTQLSALESFGLNFIVASSILSDQRV
jgi:hypothetical protein